MIRDPLWWHEHPLAMLYIVNVSALATFSYKAEQKFSEMDYMVGNRKAGRKWIQNAMFIKSTKRFGADVNRDNDGVGAGNFQPSFLSSRCHRHHGKIIINTYKQRVCTAGPLGALSFMLVN